MAVNLRGLKILRSIAIAVLALSNAAFPQTTISTGSIQGTVTDLSGAAVPGAKVTITDRFTNRVITVTTSPAGVYASGALTPGAYKVRVEAQGFKTAELELTIEVGVTAAGNVRLQVGQSTQVVQVPAPQLNSQQGTVQGVVNNHQIDNLLVSGRNFLDLAQFEPGVQL